jgi:hypothetical protein
MVDYNDMTTHLARGYCEGSVAVDGTDDGMLWNDSDEDGNVSVRKIKALTVKIQTVTLVKVDRILHALCI